MLSIGEKAIDFCLPNQSEEDVCLEDMKGKWIVLYFYPKDNTPGCTLEAINFSKDLEDLTKANTLIYGISADSCQSHVKFRNKHDIAIELLSDADHAVMEKYGVWGEKKMYGKTFLGISRTTFLIDPEGVVKHVWKKVRVKGHSESVKEKLAELQS